MTWFLPLLQLFIKKGLLPAIIFLLILFSVDLYSKNLFLTQENSQLRFDKDGQNVEIKELRSKLGDKGLSVAEYTGNQNNITDFIRDWDISNFYQDGDGNFCPRKKGENYQRMFYKYETPMTAVNLHLKFQMVNQYAKTFNYFQRLVTGLKYGDRIFSEFDIPTRDSQMVNFRITSTDGGLISGGEGKSISSTIKDKSIIDLVFRTQYKSNEEIPQSVDLDYLSSVIEYGNEKKTINYDVKIDDPNPKTAKGNIFIGSYLGGCIKILEWKVN